MANGANNILAASVSGTLAHYFKGQLDLKMGALILVGGIVGSIIGIEIFNYFLNEGSINNIISILFFGLLTLVGLSMLFESLSEIRRIKNRRFIRRKLHKHYWIHNLPFKTRIRSSKLYISVIPPIFWNINRIIILNSWCRWSFFISSNFNLYNRYACKIGTRNFIVGNDICNDRSYTVTRITK